MRDPANSAVSGPVARLFDWLHGPIYFALLDWGLQSEIFTKCAKGAGCASLADDMNLDPQQLLHLLNSLTSMGLLLKQGDEFHTAPDYASLLNVKDDSNLVATLQTLASLRHDGIENLGTLAVSADAGGRQTCPFNEGHWENAVTALTSLHRAYAARAMLQVLQGLPMWSGVKTMLDLGAGSLALAEAIVAAAPNKSVVVQDLDPVIRLMQKECVATPRISLFPGDYNDVLPAGPFDLIWASMSLYFARGDLSNLLAKLMLVLKPGGYFISLHEGLESGRSRPKIHVIGSVMPALKGKDFSFDKGTIRDAAMAAGFTHEFSRTVELELGPLELDALRRPET